MWAMSLNWCYARIDVSNVTTDCALNKHHSSSTSFILMQTRCSHTRHSQTYLRPATIPPSVSGPSHISIHSIAAGALSMSQAHPTCIPNALTQSTSQDVLQLRHKECKNCTSDRVCEQRIFLRHRRPLTNKFDIACPTFTRPPGHRLPSCDVA